ncbi:hypothetical protein ACHAXT_010363 [Thalassiosira profunda]
MAKSAFAAFAILSTAELGAASAPATAFVGHLATNRRTGSNLNDSRRYSAIPYDNDSAEPLISEELKQQGLSLLPEIPVDDQDEVDALLARKEERRAARLQRASKTNFRVTLPIVGGAVAQPTVTDETVPDAEELASLVAKGQEIAVANSVGMSLRQVHSGRRLSELALDADTLRFQSFSDELQGRRVDGDEDCADAEAEETIGAVQVLQNSALDSLNETFDGVVVSSVTLGGIAWRSGIRAGDILTATSATLGDKLWPKSTLDGVRSAISSRKVVTGTMDFEFKRLTEGGMEGITENVKSFELSLSRPIGINVEDTDDGYVTIMGISDQAAPVVKNNLRIGDRVVSVESSVGAQMWDVFSTDGLTSAVTSRLPGQSVRMLFERAEEVEEKAAVEEQPASTASASISDAVVGFRQAGTSVAASPATSAAATTAVKAQPQTAAQKMLISRSRDLLRTYITRNEVTKNVKVADRVLEAVMDAGATLDGKTLNLVMKAYNTCGSADKAIQTFEEVFGLAGDGTDRDVELVHGGKLSADISALNKFTISALMRAHAIRGDYESALLVLAAVEGNLEFSIGGRRPRSWSGQGDPFNMLPDTRVYNIALAAAAKKGTKEGLKRAVEIFDSMPEPSLSNPPLGKPAKNLVTYNTMINAFAIVGQYQNAYDVFQSLKKSPIRPDSVTYTALIKASIKAGDTEKALDLLDDMKWTGARPDIVSYNSVIESLCSAGRLFEAKDLVNEMETIEGVSPDSMTYGLLMRGLLGAGKPGPCLTLFESACADSRTAELTENVQLYTTAISAAAALGDHERALELVSRMNRVGVKPNKKTLTALMGACIAGRKFDAAADIFSKIKNPDGHAVSVGLEALCLAGKFEDALEVITDQRSGQKALKGKQVMSAYNKLIQEALFAEEYIVARDAMSGLLRAGYIPSKFTFRAMIDGLGIQLDLPARTSASAPSSDEKFDFLLFVLDSLEARKLTVDSGFYSSILFCGAQTGGLQKRIASLLARSRKSGNHQEISLTDADGTSIEEGHRIASWEDLLENYSTYKTELGPDTSFPFVRVSTKTGFGRVLAAEQAVSYRGARRAALKCNRENVDARKLLQTLNSQTRQQKQRDERTFKGLFDRGEVYDGQELEEDKAARRAAAEQEQVDPKDRDVVLGKQLVRLYEERGLDAEKQKLEQSLRLEERRAMDKAAYLSSLDNRE